ncbi:MAG: MMPL family transporter [Pirellulaceae bacterium]|nr:MMPL family transporter [Pirellulaceae bacterium]
MPAERNPLVDDSPLAAPLEGVTRLVLRAPGAVVSGAAILAVLAVVASFNGLSFKTNRLDLLNPRSEYNQRWLAYLAEFGDRDDAVIVVRADGAADLTAALDDLATQAKQHPDLFESVFHRRDLSALKRKALHFLPEDELAAIAQQVEQASILLPRGGALTDPVTALAQLNEQASRVGAASPAARAALEERFQHLAGQLLAALDPQAADAATDAPTLDPQKLTQLDPQYLLADEGRMGFVLLRLKEEGGESAKNARAIGKLREILAQARGRHERTWIGLTGMPVIEFDEMQASQTDMVWTSLLSLAGVIALFAAGYGGLRHAALASLVLLLGMAYSFGFITLTIGHLNILSSAFAVVLIGLGIDFGIHYIASYLRLRENGCDELTAMVRTASDVGPGVVTGGVTTAAAFFMAGMTDFIGIRELGVIAGGGILLCVLATVIILPPLVCLVDRQWPAARIPRILPAARWFHLPQAWPKLTATLAVVLTLLAGAGIAQLRYDHNLLNLQPRHLESAQIEREIFTRMDDSVWFAVSICASREQLLARKSQFAELATVAKTEEIVSLLPATTPAALASIRAIHDRVGDLPRQPPALAPISPRRLFEELTRAEQLLGGETPFETAASARFAAVRTALSRMSPAAAEGRLQALTSTLPAAAWSRLEKLGELCDPAAPQLTDLPPELLDRYVGRNRKHLLKVYARGNIWDMDKLALFVADVERIDSRVTGHPVQTYYASRHMQRSYLLAGAYALGAVLVLLWIDFRSLAHSLLAMLPLGLGFGQMCGLLGWLDIPLNPANMIVLPLILGIGVDDGVHLVHEWRKRKGPFTLGDSTTVAVLLTSTTTMAGFGSLILARHQGLQSLGQVLTLGVLTCLASSLLIFPAVLRWLSRQRPEVRDQETTVTRDLIEAADQEEMSALEGPAPLRLVTASDDETPTQMAEEIAILPAPPPSEPESEAPDILAFPAPRLARFEPEPEAPPTIPRRRTIPRRVEPILPISNDLEDVDGVASGRDSGLSPLERLARIRQSNR